MYIVKYRQIWTSSESNCTVGLFLETCGSYLQVWLALPPVLRLGVTPIPPDVPKLLLPVAPTARNVQEPRPMGRTPSSPRVRGRCAVGWNGKKSTRLFQRQKKLFPLSSRVREWASERMTERSGLREGSEQCGASECVSGASKGANRGANGSVLWGVDFILFLPNIGWLDGEAGHNEIGNLERIDFEEKFSKTL